MNLYCAWWLMGAGLPLPACSFPPWAGMAVWPDFRVTGAAGAWPRQTWRMQRPGTQPTPPIGPTGPLGTLWAEQAGPGVPNPMLQTIGLPGTPIVPGSAGAAGDPISG